jgi:hypothetical protein
MSPTDEAASTLHHRLTQVQTIIAILTGLIAIIGATYSMVRSFSPPADTGRVVAVVQEAPSGKAVPDAHVEILGPHDALVANLKPDPAGKVRYTLKEGTYKVRVSHEKYATAKREIQVTPGGDVDLTVELSPLPTQIRSLEHAVKRLFGR